MGDLDGATYRGELLDGPPARLRWSDGDVWIFSDVFPQLQGQWQKGQDSKRIGEIRGGTVFWDTSFKTDANALLSQSPSGALQLEVDYKQLTGTFLPGPPVSIRWDDGDVWVRTSQ